MLFGRWHDSHFCWKMGATSFVKVTVLASAAVAGSEDMRRALKASAVETRSITSSFRACRPLFRTRHYTDLRDPYFCLSLSLLVRRAQPSLIVPLYGEERDRCHDQNRQPRPPIRRSRRLSARPGGSHRQ